MKGKIYIGEWTAFKPYDNHCSTDSYYLSVCNKVKQAIHYLPLKDLKEIHENINGLCCFLTSYFEDVISQTNIWHSFVRKHEELYNKKLPFFNTDRSDYIADEINVEDIHFLTWYYLNTMNKDKIIHSKNIILSAIAAEAFEVFNEEYEYAPENELLRKCYTISPLSDFNDYFQAVSFLELILLKTYLFAPDTVQRFVEMEFNTMDELEDGYAEHYEQIVYDKRRGFVLNSHTSLLSLKAKDWAAEILGSDHPLCQSFQNMTERISGHFLYLKMDEMHIHLEHIATGIKFKVVKDSYPNTKVLENKVNSIVYIAIDKWNHEWVFSGVSYVVDFDQKFINEEKKSVSALSVTNKLGIKNELIEEILRNQEKVFLKCNNGSPVAFVPESQTDSFMNYMNECYNIFMEEDGKGMTIDKMNFSMWSPESSSMNEAQHLVFINPKGGLEVAFGVNNAFPLKSNPNCDLSESADDFLTLLFSDKISTELFLFCFNKFKSNLPILKEAPWGDYIEDIDFLLRLFKVDNYYSHPRVTVTSEETELYA